MPREMLARAREECNSWLTEYDARKIGGGKVRGLYRKGLLPVTRMFDDLFADPLLLETVEDLFAPHGFCFGGCSIKAVVPHEDARRMHLDDKVFSEPRPPSPCMINVLVALDDFTEETGATHIVPGSHQWARPVEQDIDYISAEMKAGSALLLHGGVWHQNGSNKTSNQERRALSFAYRTRQVHWDTSSDVIDELPAKLRDIYCSG